MNPRSSVVFYPGPWHVGGAESYALNIARGLSYFGQVAVLSGSRPDRRLLDDLRLPSDFEPEWRLARSCNQRSVNRLAGDADIFVNCSPWDYPLPPRSSLSAFVAYFTPELAPLSGARRLTREIAARALPNRIIWPEPLGAIARYDDLLCVSEWTARLAGERWGREAAVFYPAVRAVPARTKDRLILSVGRIAAGGTRKGHADLIEAFKHLGLKGWKLVVAGAVNYDEVSAVVEGWRRELDGSDVEIVANPTGVELQDLYGRAALYWHAAGYGVQPGSVGREHFGISIVEAMSSGAVPLAFAGGGVREIVTSGENGWLWHTLDELLATTSSLAEDDDHLARLRDAAMARATHFGIEQHDLRLQERLLRARPGVLRDGPAPDPL